MSFIAVISLKFIDNAVDRTFNKLKLKRRKDGVLVPTYKIGFWANLNESVISIEIDGGSKVRLGEHENTIYVNNVLIDLGGSVAFVYNPDGTRLFSIY